MSRRSSKTNVTLLTQILTLYNNRGEGGKQVPRLGVRNCRRLYAEFPSMTVIAAVGLEYAVVLAFGVGYGIRERVDFLPPNGLCWRSPLDGSALPTLGFLMFLAPARRRERELREL